MSRWRAGSTASIAVGAPKACDTEQRPFQLCAHVKTYPMVCGRRPGVLGLSLCATMPLHLLACTAPLLRASYFFLIGVLQFGPPAALSLNARAVRHLSTQLLCASTCPLPLILLPASHFNSPFSSLLDLLLHFIFVTAVGQWSSVLQAEMSCGRASLREGDGTPLQYSSLENPMDGGAW